MRTIIAGSRDIADFAAVEAAVNASKFQVSTVLSGAARGVDRLGEIWARRNGRAVEQYPADWDRHGKRAGYLRNAEMVDNAQALIAVWDGTSRGTAHTIRLARAAKLKVFVFIPDKHNVIRRRGLKRAT